MFPARRADAGAGSYFNGIRGGSLHWAGDRLVFPWEKTGWKLLYSVVARPGGEPRRLTPGEHEVSSVAVAVAGASYLVRMFAITAFYHRPVDAYFIDGIN